MNTLYYGDDLKILRDLYPGGLGFGGLMEGLATKIQFAVYYVKLRVRVIRGLHRPQNPLGLKWRWRVWSVERETLESELLRTESNYREVD